jgi:acyl-CoA thioesterase
VTQTHETPTNETAAGSSIEARLRDLRAVLDQGIADGVGVGSSLGILADVLEVGRTVWTLTPSKAAANAMFIVHGGVIATLMDTAMGSAVYTMLPDGALYTTLEFKVNFVRTLALDADTVSCEARTVHVGRRTATAEARVTDSAGALVAHGSCTCMIFPPSTQA